MSQKEKRGVGGERRLVWDMYCTSYYVRMAEEGREKTGEARLGGRLGGLESMAVGMRYLP